MKQVLMQFRGRRSALIQLLLRFVIDSSLYARFVSVFVHETVALPLNERARRRMDSDLFFIILKCESVLFFANLFCPAAGTGNVTKWMVFVHKWDSERTGCGRMLLPIGPDLSARGSGLRRKCLLPKHQKCE